MGKRRRRREPSPGERKKLAWRARLSERVAAARGEAPAADAKSRRAGTGEAVVIHPRLAPESVTDVVVYIGATLAVTVVMLVLPAIVYATFGRGRAAVIAAAVIFAAETLTHAAASVGRLTLDSRGIHFARRVGRRFIPWSDVQAVSRAARGELVYCGWIWPPLPPNEATRSLTSAGHLAIIYRGGISYYPALEETAFLAAIRRWAPRVRLPAGETVKAAPAVR